MKKAFLNYLTISMLLSLLICISESSEAQNRKRSGLSQLEFDVVKDATPTPTPISQDSLGQLINEVVKKPGVNYQQRSNERNRRQQNSRNPAPAKKELYDPRNPLP